MNKFYVEYSVKGKSGHESVYLLGNKSEFPASVLRGVGNIHLAQAFSSETEAIKELLEYAPKYDIREDSLSWWNVISATELGDRIWWYSGTKHKKYVCHSLPRLKKLQLDEIS